MALSCQRAAGPRRVFGAKGDWKVLDEVLAPNYVRHDQASGVTGKGPDVEKQVGTLYRTAFPDLQIKIEEMVAEGNTVAVRWTAIGTATGNPRSTGARRTRAAYRNSNGGSRGLIKIERIRHLILG